MLLCLRKCQMSTTMRMTERDSVFEFVATRGSGWVSYVLGTSKTNYWRKYNAMELIVLKCWFTSAREPVLCNWERVLCLQKYHAECAGDGIEYIWALAKNWFKCLLLSKRRSRKQFCEHVLEAINTKTTLMIEWARGCARRAQSYIVTYLYLFEYGSTGEQVGGDGPCGPQGYSYIDIERLSKQFCRHKTHQSASDTDVAFINWLLENAN